MPLITICGTPVSGKTTRMKELREFFEKTHHKEVRIVSEAIAIAMYDLGKNETYLDSQREKQLRGYIKSEVLRNLTKDNVVIVDACNYIKGCRYELYCASKYIKSTMCTVYTIKNHDEAWADNCKRLDRDKTDTSFTCCDSEPYSRVVFDALTKLRFEEPNGNNRWDSPLFTVQPTDQLDLEGIYRALFDTKPPPPNMSTQNQPLTATNFLYELENVTQGISRQILMAKNIGLDAMSFTEYPGCALEAGFTRDLTAPQLLRLRRQFLVFAKLNHKGEDANTLGRYYIQYLNNTLKD